MSPPRWDNNTTCKFVELYIQHECLWNMNLTIYRNKQARDQAMKEIVQEMAIEDFRVVEAKQKIKSIRATYQQEQRKVIKSEKSGAGAEDVYKPNMKWFAAMHGIINNGQLKRNTTSNMDSRTTAKNDDNIVDTESIPTEQVTQQSEPVASTSTRNEATRSAKHPIVTPRVRRTRNKVADVKTAIEELKVLNQAINREDIEDECDVFAKHIAMQLKKLPDAICIMAQDEIQRVLTRCRLNALQSSGRTSACSNRTASSLYQQLDISNPSSVQGNTFSTPVTSPLSTDPSTETFSNVSNYNNNMFDSQEATRTTPGDVLSAAILSLSNDYNM